MRRLLGIGILAAAALLSCRFDFDGPFTPGSPSYVGDDWARDRDGDGVADSVQKYFPNCTLPPSKCVEVAKSLARVQGVQPSLTARDMILWLGDPAATPRLTWVPAERSLKGYELRSSAPAVVMPKGDKVEAVGEGFAQIEVTVPDDSLSAFFLAQVVGAGKRVVALSASDMVVPEGRDTVPVIAWTPSDATFKTYSLTSDNPSVAPIVNNRILGLAPGAATVTVEARDGGFRSAITVAVTRSDIPVESLFVEDLYLVIGGGAQAPDIHFYPSEATNKKYLLVSGDASVAAVSADNRRIEPKSKGTARVVALSLDGSDKSAQFTVYVTDVAVPVRGISAAPMKLTAGGGSASPELTWDPPNASNRGYALYSDNPNVAEARGTLVKPASKGKAQITVTTDDGGFQATFIAEVVDPDTSVHVDSVVAESLSLAVGTQIRPNLTWHPANAGNRAYTLTSANTAVAEPSGEFVKAIAAGKTSLVVRSEDGGKKDTFTVTVFLAHIPVQSVNAPSLNLVAGGAATLVSPTIVPATASDKSFSLTSDNESVASIVSGSSVKPVAVGNATITIHAADNVTGTFTVSVSAQAVHVTSVALANFTMKLGDPPYTLQPVFDPANATDKSFKILGSSDTTVAGFTALTKVTAKKAGKSRITIETIDGQKSAACTVTVSVPVKSVDAANQTIRKGDSDQVPNLTWDPPNASDKRYSLQSNNPTVVSIPAAGNKLHAVAGGSAQVIVTTTDGTKKDTFTVTVGVPVVSVSVANISMNKADPDKDPVVTWNPTDATDKGFTLASKNTAVATVSGTKVHAVGGGTAQFELTSTDQGKIATFTVTVNVPVQSISAADITMKKNGPDTLPVLTWTPPDASNKGYTLVSKNEAVVTVTNTVPAKIHAVAGGTAQVEVTVEGSKKATFNVTVTVPVTGVTAATFALHTGDPDRDAILTWSPPDASNKNYTLEVVPGSSRPVVSISSSNKVHALASGKAMVKVRTADGGFTYDFEVTVLPAVDSIAVAPFSISKGGVATVPVVFYPPSAPNKNFTLSGGNPAIAVPAANGSKQVQAVGGGVTTLTATSEDGDRQAVFQVTVLAPVTGIKGQAMNMYSGQDARPPLIWSPADATDKGYSMESSNKLAVTINGESIHANDCLLGLNCSARVAITTHDGNFTDTISVTVAPPCNPDICGPAAAGP